MEFIMKTGDLVEGFYFDAMLVEVIEDDRLHANMEYCRASIDKHMFRDNSYEGRDFMSNNPDSCDAIIAAPEKHYMAKLVEGVWWWVNDCAKCCGHERDWMGSECDKHDVCRTCGASRSEIKETPWGGNHGWQCVPCADAESKAAKIEALEKMQAKVDRGEYDSWDYRGQDNIKCPHCDHEYEPCTADGVPEGKETCGVCGGEFSITPDYSISYSTELVGEQLTLESITQK